MNIYYFSDKNREHQLQFTKYSLSDILAQIAGDTPTDDLVVAAYFTQRPAWTGGIAFTRSWLRRDQFQSYRGRWKFTRQFMTPTDLPESYKLIRLHLGTARSNYPIEQIDSYGWQLRYDSLEDHVAFLFAHELHHFRRYHLNLHPREGENAANLWALRRAAELGYRIQGAKIVRSKSKSGFSKFLSARLYIDPYKKYRSLATGDSLIIRFDSGGRYQGKIAVVMRPIRKNSRRIVIRTEDGKTWRWPLEWISMMK
ncbi:MAG: hypothetical protein ACOY90_09855 [Candidatus Zhuqueibacterota bacterium]